MDIRRILTAMVLAAGATLAANADTYTLNREQLPVDAQEFLTQYFPKHRVGMIKVDKHLLKKTDYDVKLVNGTKIEFDNSGKWTSVDCKSGKVPEKLVPSAIRNYISKNYKGTSIIKIEKKTLAYEITLSDGVEVTFDRLGKFKSVKMLD